MFLAILVVFSLFMLYKWVERKPANYPPGPTILPFIGSLFNENRQNFHLAMERMRDKYGPVIGLMFGPRPAIAVCGPEEVLEVFSREDFSGRPSLTRRPENGVMFANDEHWKQQRRFTLRHLRDFGFGKNTVAQMILQEFEEFCDHKLKDEIVIEGSGLFNTSAINILWAMIAGERLSYEDKDFQALLVNLEKFFRSGSPTGSVIDNLPGLRKFLSLFHEFEDEKTEKDLREFFVKVAAEHEKTRSDVPRDFLDCYLEQLEKEDRHGSFNKEVMYEVMRDLFAAGTESSSNTVSFAIMYLLLNPEWEKKIFEEIDRVIGDRTPAFEDMPRLPLVQAYLYEVQRHNTIAPLSVPHATTAEATLAGYTIPKDTFVLLSIWTLLQDKKHWGDPENFRPERFIDSKGEFVKDSYMRLFGSGSRVCLGETLAKNFTFLFFVLMVQRYKISLPKGSPRPETLCKPGFTTAPQKFLIQLQRR